MATHKPINILEAFAAAPPPLDYVLPNMVAGTVGALVSPGGAGKSMLALQLAAQIAVLNQWAKQGYVFEKPKETCKQMGEAVGNKSNILLMGNTHMY